MNAPKAPRVRLVEDACVTVPWFRWPTTPQLRKQIERSPDKRTLRVCATLIDGRERRNG